MRHPLRDFAMTRRSRFNTSLNCGAGVQDHNDPPMEPVVIVADSELQERPSPKKISFVYNESRVRRHLATRGCRRSGKTAGGRANAGDHCRSRRPNSRGMKYLVELAETLQAGGGPRWTDEPSVAASAQSVRRGRGLARTPTSCSASSSPISGRCERIPRSIERSSRSITKA
jgi:hypothetical protein